MSLKKDKAKVLGEFFDDERIKTFLEFDAPTDVDTDFHLLEKAYRGMNVENFATFLTFFKEAGHDINATNPKGESLLALVKQHRLGDEYAKVLQQAGATA